MVLILFFSHGEKWHQRRKIITPTFHFDILKEFLIVMNEKVDIMVNNLEKFANSNEKIDIVNKIRLCTLDIICGNNRFEFKYYFKYCNRITLSL